MAKISTDKFIRQMINWRKIFAMYVTNEKLIFLIFIEPFKIEKGKQKINTK